MQNLAAYSFESTDVDAVERLGRIDVLIEKWLKKKGVLNLTVADGDFKSKTPDGTGQFSRRTIESSIGVIREIELIETAERDATFTTILQITAFDKTVSVYALLGVTPNASNVSPIKIPARCPWIIRELINSFNDWKFAGQDVPIGLPFDATNIKSTISLSKALRDPGRRLPLVVISMDEDESVWRDLPNKAAEQLIGLADVAFVDAESSWWLTDELGPKDSCYLGAVKLYWPSLRRDGSFEKVTWLANRLLSFGEDAAGLSKFLAVLRSTIMSTAALTMVPPNAFRDIQNASTKERLQALEGAAKDQELDSIVDENTKLTTELQEAQQTIASLQWKLAAALARENKETDAEDEGGDLTEGPDMPGPPQSGDIRFYKKIGSGGGVDTLVITDSCNHKSSSWRTAFKGDKAEKGLLKLEGRNDWKTIAHCSACTGGGRWRVHW